MQASASVLPQSLSKIYVKIVGYQVKSDMKALCVVSVLADTWLCFWWNCLAHGLSSLPTWHSKTLKKTKNPPGLNTLLISWMTGHIPCELPFPRSREQECPCKPPGGSRAPSSAVNIYPRGEGVGRGNSLISCYEKFEDCAILVWSFYNLVLALVLGGFI